MKGSKIAEIPVKTVNVREKYTLGLVDPVLGCSAWVEASRDTVVLRDSIVGTGFCV